ncbi:MAG: hypothetical protein WA821_06395, partial [Anaerolineales bacterium]
AVAEMLLAQFGVLGLLAGLYHLLGNSSLSRLSLVSGWVAVVSIVWSLGYATTDSYVYLLPFFLVFAIWIGLGVGNIGTQLAQRKNWISLGVSGILLASFLGMAVMNYPSIDLSKDHSSEKFAQEAVAALPPQAIVVTKGDMALFGLWYYHYVLKERPDIAVVGNGLLLNAWYRDGVLHDTYPTLNATLSASSTDLTSSQDFIAHANPTRPVCLVIVDEKDISIVCYLPVSQKSDTPFISIIQPIEK